MPIPFILGAGAFIAGAIGVGAHLSAQEKNEKAQALNDEAESLYNNAARSLEQAKAKAEQSLLCLGNNKKDVLETSVKQFIVVYNRIKNIELSESVGINEIKNFSISQNGVLQLVEMSNIYQSAFKSSTAGVATGVIMSLAASGSLLTVSGAISSAGTALVAGKIGAAAGLTGTALSLSAAVTPLAAIAAPVILFTGLSASSKADQNLEKARSRYAQAQAAVEKMRTSELICDAIHKKAYMFNDLLNELNEMFSYCTVLLDAVTKKKLWFFQDKVDARQFNENELKLVAVTRALAGAVKAVIDVPILNGNSEITIESTNVYNETLNKLPAFSNAVEEIKTTTYIGNPVLVKSKNGDYVQKNNSPEFELFKIIAFIAVVVWVCMSILGTQDNEDVEVSSVTPNVVVNNKDVRLSKQIVRNKEAKLSIQEIEQIASRESILGDRYFEEKNYKQAETCYSKALEYKKDNVLLLYKKALVLKELGRYNEALSDMEKVIQKEPSPYNRYFKAELLKLSGDNINALAVVNDLLKEYPGNGDYLKLKSSLIPKETNLQTSKTDNDKLDKTLTAGFIAQQTKTVVSSMDGFKKFVDETYNYSFLYPKNLGVIEQELVSKGKECNGYSYDVKPGIKAHFDVIFNHGASAKKISNELTSELVRDQSNAYVKCFVADEWFDLQWRDGYHKIIVKREYVTKKYRYRTWVKADNIEVFSDNEKLIRGIIDGFESPNYKDIKKRENKKRKKAIKETMKEMEKLARE